ncbi:unnamed protein product [Penicillium pancosmium]
MRRSTMWFRLTWILSSFILWICSVPTFALPSTPYPSPYHLESKVRTLSRSSDSLYNHTLLRKRSDDPSYSEANYIWEDGSNRIFHVANSADQFQDADKAYAQLKLGNELGSEGYGTVYEGSLKSRNSDSNQEGAAKQSAANGQVAVNGAILQKSIDSDNVAEVYEIFWQPSDKKSIIIMEQLQSDADSTLQEIAKDITKRSGADYKAYTSKMMEGAILGLRDTHAAGIAHRDIKPENIMLSDCNDEYKLIDYDHAIRNDVLQAGNQGTAFGSPLYEAPEVDTDAYNGYQADVDSLAWMHFDIMNSTLRYTQPDRLQDLMAYTRGDQASSKQDLKGKLIKELRACGVHFSVKYPTTFKMAGLIAQALQPVERRISMYEYYKQWCKLTGTAEGSADEWSNDTDGANWDYRVQ